MVETRVPGVNNKGQVPTAESLLKGARVTIPKPGVNRDGMEPTAASLVRGATVANENSTPLKTKISADTLAALKSEAALKGWSRQQLADAIRQAGG